jgi:hypothetical protein
MQKDLEPYRDYIEEAKKSEQKTSSSIEQPLDDKKRWKFSKKEDDYEYAKITVSERLSKDTQASVYTVRIPSNIAEQLGLSNQHKIGFKMDISNPQNPQLKVKIKKRE